MKKRILSVLLVTLMLCSTITGCSVSEPGSKGNTSADADSTDTSNNAETTGGEKIIRITQSAGGEIDPGVITDFTSCMAVVNMYDSLVYPDMDNNAVASVAK